jgi:hypothetical protein
MVSDMRVTLHAIVAKPGFASIVVLTRTRLGACAPMFRVFYAVLSRSRQST